MILGGIIINLILPLSWLVQTIGIFGKDIIEIIWSPFNCLSLSLSTSESNLICSILKNLIYPLSNPIINLEYSSEIVIEDILGWIISISLITSDSFINLSLWIFNIPSFDKVINKQYLSECVIPIISPLWLWNSFKITPLLIFIHLIFPWLFPKYNLIKVLSVT